MSFNWQNQQNYDQNSGYNPNVPPYPQQQGGYPPQGGYPNQQGGYPGAYPAGFPQPQGGYPGGQGFAAPPPMGFHVPIDPEAQHPKPGDSGQEYDGIEFSDQSIRKGFIRKVYSILCVQLGITVGFIALFLYHDGIKHWTRQNPMFLFAVMGMSIVMLIALACCESVRRKSPTNFICLGIFTLLEGFLLGAISSSYNEQSVLLAVGITTVICLALTLFSFQTKWDFTAMGGILFVCVIILFLFGILAIFFPVLKVFYACAGALLFSVYLVYDTQLMMGGKKKYSISPEEYVFAALNLYIDIINIFMYILAIIGTRD